MTDDRLDAVWNTLAEIRRVVEKARHTRTGSQAADAVMQALTANLLGILGPAPETT